MLYVLDTDFEVTKMVRRKMNNPDDVFMIIGYNINYINDRGDVIGYDLILSDSDANTLICRPFEVELIEEEKENSL